MCSRIMRFDRASPREKLNITHLSECTDVMLICLQRTFREIMFLQELDNHDNIIKCAWT